MLDVKQRQLHTVSRLGDVTPSCKEQLNFKRGTNKAEFMTGRELNFGLVLRSWPWIEWGTVTYKFQFPDYSQTRVKLNEVILLSFMLGVYFISELAKFNPHEGHIFRFKDSPEGRTCVHVSGSFKIFNDNRTLCALQQVSGQTVGSKQTHFVRVRQSGEITFQSYRFQCSRWHKR